MKHIIKHGSAEESLKWEYRCSKCGCVWTDDHDKKGSCGYCSMCPNCELQRPHSHAVIITREDYEERIEYGK